METTTVFNSHTDLPMNIREELISYYKETGHRSICNDSYSRYPYIGSLNGRNAVLDEWFLSQLKNTVDYIMIHWDW